MHIITLRQILIIKCINHSKLYKERLSIVKNLLSENGDEPNEEKVVQELGASVRALESIPTAIFCFLRAQRRIKRIRTDNPFRRAIQYAVSYKLYFYHKNFIVDQIIV